MRLVVKGDGFSELILQEIAAITDHAILDLAQVAHDEGERTVKLSMTRFPFERHARFLGTVPLFNYDKEHGIRARVRIGAVESVSITNNYESGASETVIAQGLSVRGNRLYLCSHEEDHGEPFYSMDIQVSFLDLEIHDRED